MASYVLTSGASRLEINDGDDNCNTLAEVLEAYRAQLNIPADATPTVNGVPAPTSTPINNGDEVAFTKTSGSKGR